MLRSLALSLSVAAFLPFASPPAPGKIDLAAAAGFS